MNRLVVFTATWCKPCKVLKNNMSKLSSELSDKIQIYDIDDYREVAIQYNIEAVPTIIVTKDGKEVSRNLGYKSVEELEQLFYV